MKQKFQGGNADRNGVDLGVNVQNMTKLTTW